MDTEYVPYSVSIACPKYQNFAPAKYLSNKSVKRLTVYATVGSSCSGQIGIVNDTFPSQLSYKHR